MSFFQPNILTTPGCKFNEGQWVAKIRETLDEELDEAIEIPVTIFGVPKPLMMFSPDSYIPQQVSMGPYHRLRMELYDTERYKVEAAKRIQQVLPNVDLETLVERLMKRDQHIRACYHRPVNFGSEALAWIMALDACFTFEFTHACGLKKGKILKKVPSGLSHIIDSSGKKMAHNSILRDLLMLENQIPLLVMRMLLELHFCSKETADQHLLTILTSMSRSLSPFKAAEKAEMAAVREYAHVLDFLYHFIVPEADIPYPKKEKKRKREELCEAEAEPTKLCKLVCSVWCLLSKLILGFIRVVKCIIFWKPLKLLVKIPWTIMMKIPIFRILKDQFERVNETLHKEKDEDEESGSSHHEKPPLMEEIAIPSVTQLVKVGVKFAATSGGISSIKFDNKTLTLHMPVIKLDENSGVVLRNLVAYEACTAPGPLVLARYMELMNGIIDTDADANVLCGKGIIVNHMKSEKEVAEMWNGMCNSVRLTKVPLLDKAIVDVNKFYNEHWRVRMGRFMRDNVFGSWKILTFVAAIVMLVLVCMEDFCQIYSCSRIFPKIEALQPLNPNLD
ncbi:putative UPF0481 protein At3g02645 [Salvia hispanica]|uniref:putative UPF0481 protein At3g02645 n=1 Tax=Salvia hispanica TaxID=49212 RepID=UPI0020099E35|nr:putative UPF0481 protein At3g02645 [Salvia hispanica]